MNHHINKTEIRIAALQRSGHHAVVEWLLDSCGERSVFINLCQPGQPVFNEDRIRRKLDYRLTLRNFPDYDLTKDCAGNFQPKDLLIYNFENYPLYDALNAASDQERDMLVGRSGQRIDMIIQRDPLNAFASYYERNREKLSPSDFHQWLQLWCSYAKASMENLDFPLTTIHYNLWLDSAGYRAEIAKKVGFEGAASLPRHTVKWGNGSSFEQSSEANKSALEQRWKRFAEDDVYRSLITHPEFASTIRAYLKHIDRSELTMAFDSLQVS